MFEFAVFWIFAAILVIAASCVIMVRNPVHSALFLVLAFFTAAALWMLLRAEFLAIALVLVYVGAVMVLFLFVVMMLDINLERLREGFWTYLPLGATVGILMVVEMVLVLGGRYFGIEAVPGPMDPGPGASNRSEEHTSELQSQSNLVCRLLLEKKKNVRYGVFDWLGAVLVYTA